MNKSIILYILGRLIIVEGFFLIIAALVSLLYGEASYISFLQIASINFVLGLISWLTTRKTEKQLGKKEGYIVVSFVWIVFSIFGALPFVISGTIPSFTNAFFETMSGFTTTGSSILSATEIDNLNHGMHFWRSIIQWIGGMGIIVMALAIFPLLGINSLQLFVAEVPGPSKDKIKPTIKQTAKSLWGIYIFFTLLETILLYFGGMSFFDAICHSFTTMATGGFSTKGASIAFYDSSYIHYVIAIFMVIAGTNFTLAFYAVKFKWKKIYSDEEFKSYLYFVIGFTAVITAFLVIMQNQNFSISLRDSFFTVVSIITTTGFATADYITWKGFIIVIVFILMFIGGSAGSTAGGIKVIRIVFVIKNIYFELRRIIHPNAVIPVRYNKQAVNQKIINNALAFITIYILTFVFGTIFISFFGYNLDTSMGSVAATLGNIGPGIGDVGPSGNFKEFPDIAKWVFSFLMLLGRLELFTIMVIFSKSFWKA